jgi:OPA family glycerol-3-phosphate transporter-like MFS transporter
VPVYFLGDDFKHDPLGKWISISLPVGMALGALTNGWISDRFCGSRRSGVIALFMILAAVSAMGMYLMPAGHWLGVLVIIGAILGWFGA